MPVLLAIVITVATLAAVRAQPASRPAIQTATWRYQVRMEAGGQTITTVLKTVDVRDERGLVIVSETTRMPAGDTVDEVELTRDALVTRKRSLTQGPMRMMAVFEAGRAKGSVTVGTTTKPFDVETGGAIYGDGPAAHVIFSAAPVAIGYTVALRGFDMFDLTTKIKQATVVGVEKVTVPAGTFKAFRLRIEPERGVDQESLWLDVDSRRVVRITTAIADAAAVIVSELAR